MIEAAKRLQEVKEYYFSKKLREVRQLIQAGKPIINIGIGSPDIDPPRQVIEAMCSAMQQTGVHGYQSYQGLPELREAMRFFYKTHYQVELEPQSEILPLMGSKEGIFHISMAFLDPGDEVLIPNPGYPTYSSVTRLVGANPFYYNLSENNQWFPDLNLLKKLDLSRVKLMWLNYPHMPTGAQATLSQFSDLIQFAKARNILLAHDNPYSLILTDQPKSILQVEGAKEVCVELNSISKSNNMAGWRVGMVCGRKEFVNQILQVKSNLDSGMFFGIQQGAIEALQLNENWYKELNSLYSKRRAIAWQIADELGCTYHRENAGLFVWAKLPNEKKAEEIADLLLYKYDVFLTPGTVFGSNGEGYIRLSLCVPEDNLKQVLFRLKNKNK